MRAAVLREFGGPIVIEEVDTPVPGAGEVLVKVEACGVCHSDLHLAQGDWDMLRGITKMPGHSEKNRIHAAMATEDCSVERLDRGRILGGETIHLEFKKS